MVVFRGGLPAGEYMTTAEVADFLCCTRQWVRRLGDQCLIVVYRTPWGQLFPRGSVEEYARRDVHLEERRERRARRAADALPTTIVFPRYTPVGRMSGGGGGPD